MLRQVHIMTLTLKVMIKKSNFKVGAHLRISKYKTIFANDHTPN